MIDWLTDTLFATSLLMGLVLLIREPVRRHFGPAAAYGLWLIPALRLVMPPLTKTVVRTASPLVHPPTSAAQAALSSVTPFAEPGMIEQLGGFQTLAIAAWLMGATAMLLGGLLVYRSQRREVLRGSVQLARLDGVRIIRSSAVRGPMAFGVFDRIVALPLDFDERYEPQERRLAFDHELSHHRSGDLAVNHLAFALLCLQWFNPLAWMAHGAFRFDQEAACDARVLNQVGDRDRATYARAIAKAASGRALLFAGALDRPGTLHRRLKSMLTKPSNSRRVTGKALIALGAATALPLTASWATHYVEAAPAGIPAAAPKALATAPLAASAPTAAISTMAASGKAVSPNKDARENPDGSVTLAGGLKLDKGSTAFFANDDVLLNGKVRRLDQLSSSERSQLRAAITNSQRDLAKQRAELPKELAELQQEADRARSGAMKREFMQDREDLRRDLAEVNSEADALRAAGEDPEKRKAEILRDLSDVEAIDIDKEIREALEAADPRKIEAELRNAEQQMTRMLAKLDQLDRR